VSQIDDDRQEIMDAVKRAMSDYLTAALEHHQLNCPNSNLSPRITQLETRQAQVRKDLYNGEDKPGFLEDAREFFAESRSIRRWKGRVWAAFGAAIVLSGIIFNQPISDSWKAFHALVRLADRADVIIKLSQEWEQFYNVPQVPAPVPPPKIKHRSFFEQPRSDVKPEQQSTQAKEE
jgi:hypothetical protein